MGGKVHIIVRGIDRHNHNISVHYLHEIDHASGRGITQYPSSTLANGAPG